MMQPNVTSKGTLPMIRWPQERVLAEARRRSQEHLEPRKIQQMLTDLLREAGWSEDEFIDALCEDVIRRGSR